MRFKNEIDVLSSIAAKILANEDLESILQAIISNLREHLDAFGGCIMFPDQKKKYLRAQSYTNRPDIEYIIRFIRPIIFQSKFSLSNPKILLSQCYLNNKIYESEKMEDFFSPVIPALAIKSISKIANVKTHLAMPIRVSGSPIGVLYTAFQRKLTAREHAIVQFYANLSGLALNNQQKLTRLKELYENEKQTTSMLSHELKTPVAIAHNSHQLLNLFLEKNKDIIDPDTYKQLITRADDMKYSIQRINNICNSILSLREVESHFPNSLQDIDINKQFEQLIECFKSKASSKGLEFRSKLSSIKGKYKGAVIQLEQISTILLDNAIKYTEKGYVEFDIKQTDKKLSVSVDDTGIGIPSDLKEKVFERFYRHHEGLRKRTEGLGLGLYIAKRITSELSGKLDLVPKKRKKGSKFLVEIPVFKA